MAKKGPSKHSRAARRATSPGIDTDKSLKDIKPPESTADHRPSVLGIHQSAGVSKKTKQGRKSVPSTRARRRQEKGLDRAAAVGERTAQKVQRSKTQARSIDYRRKAWDEINSKIEADVSADAASKKAAWALMVADGADGSDEDEDVDSGDEAVRKFYDDLDENMGEADAAAPVVAFETAVPLAVLAGGDEIM
ncbi:hypothetical protein CMQ_5821 [Grosmannia clavigera kw1407]|uniref:Alb1-domain-containing protein n=1 Tax=Grosmannia clavigera (strain kw1407 / UAMH 11150) TaxID=655863 RepID=F0XIM5_GROCL|nr:uncharacterized protein CMQ_5821 [Grosmannia clavigera kw1407]EFX02460.1 hypothetical protein CMQ_5821 [Grosmannia clavigera kw1407]